MRGGRGGPLGGGPFGGGHRGRGRARRGEVRLGLLLLLGEQPRNGYQLMQTIEERSDGRWRPSPGSVYPTLAQLEDERLIRSTELDGAKVFELTDAGRAHLAERGDAPAPWADDETDEDAGANLRTLIGGLATAAIQVRQAGDDAQIAKAAGVLAEARRELYRILAEDPEA
jgi:DNA-binding PadR family transcriptional regulator